MQLTRVSSLAVDFNAELHLLHTPDDASRACPPTPFCNDEERVGLVFRSPGGCGVLVLVRRRRGCWRIFRFERSRRPPKGNGVLARMGAAATRERARQSESLLLAYRDKLLIELFDFWVSLVPAVLYTRECPSLPVCSGRAYGGRCSFHTHM